MLVAGGGVSHEGRQCFRVMKVVGDYESKKMILVMM